MAANDVKEALIAASIPVVDVSCPSDDKATWVVNFAPGTTQTQRDQAAQIITAYAEPTPNTLLDKFAEQRIGEKALMATALALYECWPNPLMTKAQLKARAKAIFKTL